MNSQLPTLQRWFVDNVNPVRGLKKRFLTDRVVDHNKSPVAADRTFIVTGSAEGWRFLTKGEPPRWTMRTAGQPRPQRPECGDESDWPLDFNGQPACPWKYVNLLYLLDAQTGEVSTFETDSIGGGIAVRELADQIVAMQTTEGALVAPVVALEAASFKTRYGQKLRPHFRITGWKIANEKQAALAISYGADDGELS